MHGLTKRAWRKSGKLVTTSTPGRVYGGVIYNKKPAKPTVDTGGILGTKIPLQPTAGPISPTPGQSLGTKRRQKSPTSKLISEKDIVSYAEGLQEIISALVQKQLASLWNPESFAKMEKKSKVALVAGGDTNIQNKKSKTVPNDSAEVLQSSPEKELGKEKSVAAFAARAVEDLFGLETLEDIHTPQRVQRMAAGITGEQIRLANHRKEVVQGLLAFMRGEIERSVAPGTHVEKRNTQRQINAYVKKHGHAPKDFFELEPTAPANITPTIPLSTVDDVYTFWQLPKESAVAPNAGHDNQGQTRLVLSICLPTKAQPASRADWSWVSVDVGVDNKIVAQYIEGTVLLCLPTLQVRRNKLKASITIDKLSPKKVLDPRIVMSYDWGSKKLLTGALLWQDLDGVIRTSGPEHMFVFQARKYVAKDYQRQMRAQYLRAKIVKYQANMEGTTSLVEKARLGRKIEKYTEDAAHIDTKRRNANKELARLAACWVVSQALAYGAGMVVIENLDAMEPAFDKKQRNKLSQLIRGMLRDALKTACEQAGIIFGEVNPDYTSKICFTCGSWLKFKTAPNGKTGRAWAVCAQCGLSCDRDYNAAVNIGTRELRTPGTGKTRTYTGHEPNSYPGDLGGVQVKRIRHGQKIPSKRTSKIHKVRKIRVRTRAGAPVQPGRVEQNNIVANPGQTTKDSTAAVVPEVSATSTKNVTAKTSNAHNKSSKDKTQNSKPKPTPRPPKAGYQDPLRRKSRRSNSVCTVPRPGMRASALPVVHRWVRRTSSEAGPSSTAKPSENSASPSAQAAQPPPPASLETVRVQVRVLDGMRYAHRHSINATPVRLPRDDFELVGISDSVLSGLSNKV